MIKDDSLKLKITITRTIKRFYQTEGDLCLGHAKASWFQKIVSMVKLQAIPGSNNLINQTWSPSVLTYHERSSEKLEGNDCI